MIVLPIVDRELRVAARRDATYRIRVWAAFAGIALAAWITLDMSWQWGSPAAQGQSLFYTLSGLAFAYCLFIGARVTSDCVSEEKREGTLGLLFLTDLKGLDVVLGKLVASSLNSFYGLIAVVPLLAISLLLGGVTFQQFAQMVFVLVNALFFSVSTGLFVSALSRHERKSMLGTLLIVVTVAFLPFSVVFVLMTVEWVQDPSALAPLVPWLMMSPLYSYLMSLPWVPLRILPIPAWSFWASAALVFGVSWVLLLVTARLLPVLWRDRPETSAAGKELGLAESWRLWARGTDAQRRWLRLALLARNPYLWLVSRDRLKPAYVWSFLLAMVAVWLWGYWQHREVMFDFYPLVPTLFLVHTVLKMWIISEVSHRLVDDQRNGALELLLSTPLTMDQILRGQRLALVRQFWGPVVVLCALELMVFRSAFAIHLIVPVLIMLIADLFTLMWVAMRLSLTARNVNEVFLKSILLVLMLPWVVHLVAWPISVFAWQRLVSETWEPLFRHRVHFWLAVGLLNNAAVLYWAQPQLFSKIAARAQRSFHSALLLRQKWSAWRLKTEV